ncbi:MAG: DNA polymerase III subunit gamma/tau [Lactobacillus sp.]
MVYQALYRKWRPQTFDSIVGQTAITSTLKNAIVRGTVSHAFLFAGPRGTGKTSCAKIFAKALNCTHLQAGEPCNQCDNCLATDKGAMPDIIEIDAASNNGVDEIRNIRDKVKYAPTQGRVKVYIIDEVHMLSLGAFNALLKTLEEPPEHVVFILATTELQKVPATIISRTQRYQFKRIAKADLEARMQYVLAQEQIKYEPEALAVIAQVADGGMRDALSILDQLLSYETGQIKYADALKVTGFAAQAGVEQLLVQLLTQSPTESLVKADKLLQEGASPKNLLIELIRLATAALVLVKAGKSASAQAVFLTDSVVTTLKKVDVPRYFQLIELANMALLDLRYTNQQQIPLQVFIVKTSREPSAPAGDEKLAATLATLQQKVASLSQQLKAMQANGSVTKVATRPTDVNKVKSAVTAKPAVKVASRDHNRQAVYQVLAQATKADLQAIKQIWPDLLSVLKVSERALLEVLEPVAASPKQVVMKCKYTLWFEKASSNSDLLTRLEAEIERFAKHAYTIVLVPDGDWLAVRKDFVTSHQKELRQQRGTTEKSDSGETALDETPVVTKAKALFGDTVNVKE